MEWNTLLAHRLEEPLSAWFASQAEWKGAPPRLVWQETRPEFEGELTLVLFGPAKQAGVTPASLADRLQSLWSTLTLDDGLPLVASATSVGGFLNLSLSQAYWRWRWSQGYALDRKDSTESNSPQTIVLEYSSPNTNKPLHLGHVRNNLLGDSMYRILLALGNRVVRVQVINDRGIHICKSMLAWQKFGQGQDPQAAGIKGDHWVGHFYVEFERAFQTEVQSLVAQGRSQEEAENEAPILMEARRMLQQWEQGDPEVVALWQKMNTWVYQGFEVTYQRLGIGFDRNYYESETYLLGKTLVERGLSEGLFRRDDSGAVWVDLQDQGLDSKILLRSDGTSVYITQDLGTAEQRQKDWGFDRMIYTVANEQDYHFKVLFAILDRLGYSWAKQCYHLSYGMVDLPHGRMKSREGTVVDADDLMDEVQSMAAAKLAESDKLQDLDSSQKDALALQIGLAALKFYLLKVDPTKRMVYNPVEALDLQGHTGPFVQYAHARLSSVLSKVGADAVQESGGLGLAYTAWQPTERNLLRQFSRWAVAVQAAAKENNPSHVADFAYGLATAFNRFYHECPVLQEPDPDRRSFRLGLCRQTRILLHESLALLGISA
ncbi:MAG: arginine--tRNA ligase, partial [Bacteroidota bacterium]